MIEGCKLMCDVGEESKGTVIQLVSEDKGRSSFRTNRNITAFKLMEILAMECYCDWKTHRRKIFDNI